MISTDKKILEENSEAWRRMIEYGGLVEKLHIIVFSRRKSKAQNPNANVFLYPTNSKSKLFYICDAIKIGREILKNDGQWLITAQDPFETGFAGWRLAKKFKIPWQIQVHTDFLSPYFAKESAVNKIRVLLGKFLVKRANSIRVVSERIKKSILENCKLAIGNSAIFILPIFVDTGSIKNAPIKADLRKKYPQFDFIILMASRFSKEKNIELAIEAMADIVKRFPKTGLVIVGDGPEEKNYELRIKNYGLENNVIMENWTNEPASYYKTTDLFLLTSNYEGYGRTLVEAAAAGCKIISSDVGVAPEILEKENIFMVGGKKGLTGKIIAAIEGKIKPAKPLAVKTKEEYLAGYKESWETCL